jgi:homoserine acetyltransferase
VVTADPDFRNAIDGNFGTLLPGRSYLQYQGEKFIQRFDAKLLLAHHRWPWTVRHRGELRQPRCRFCKDRRARCVVIVSLSGDWTFVPEQSEGTRDRARATEEAGLVLSPRPTAGARRLPDPHRRN